ncbi:MAG: hypothetical protein K8R23_14310 [Chthoniobacter sp.]|nr:hypothetical protein [Chthoniobacter sp.]
METFSTLLASTSFYSATPPIAWAWILGITSAAVFVATLVFAFRWQGIALATPRQKKWAKAALAIWLVGPPVWFWFEYFWVFKDYGDFAQFEHFKYGQEQAAKIWAGTLVFLYAVHKLHSPPKDE